MSEKELYCYHAMQGMSVNTDGRVRPCCVRTLDEPNYLGKSPRRDLDNTIIVNTVDEFLNLDLLKNLRKDLKNGIKNSICDYCWKREDAGLQSFRQIHNEDYKDLITEDKWKYLSDDGSLDSKSITYLDISLGNVCNLKCRSCNAQASHSWIDDAEAYGKDLLDYNNSNIEVAKKIANEPWYSKAFKEGFYDEVLPKVKGINFIGGEPLVVKEHYEFLDHIVKNGWSKNMKLAYNTNGTTIPDNLLETWRNFERINISLSLDAYGDLAHYVRYPSKWKVIERNVKKLGEHAKTRDHFTLQIHTTLSLLNIHDLPKMLSFGKEQFKTWNYYSEEHNTNFGFVNVIPHFNIVDYPSYLHVKNLPDHIKLEVMKMLDNEYNKYTNADDIPDWVKHNVYEVKNLKNLIEQPRNNDEWELFLKVTKASDKFRNIKIQDYIPWMKNYIDK